MTPKQKRFCDEYLIDCNATQAYIRAGFSPKGARQGAERLLSKVDIQEYIDAQLQKLHSSKVADAQEVLEYLTSVMRGETQSEYITVEGTGDGCSQTVITKKAPDEKDRLKAGELLGKRHRLFTEKVDMNVNLPVFMEGEDDLEE